MMAAKVATMRQGSQPANLPVSPTQGQAANLLGVSERSVRNAAVVRREGVPELVEQVERGEIAVSVSKINSSPQLHLAQQVPAPNIRIVGDGSNRCSKNVKMASAAPSEPDEQVVRIRGFRRPARSRPRSADLHRKGGEPRRAAFIKCQSALNAAPAPSKGADCAKLSKPRMMRYMPAAIWTNNKLGSTSSGFLCIVPMMTNIPIKISVTPYANRKKYRTKYSPKEAARITVINMGPVIFAAIHCRCIARYTRMITKTLPKPSSQRGLASRRYCLSVSVGFGGIRCKPPFLTRDQPVADLDDIAATRRPRTPIASACGASTAAIVLVRAFRLAVGFSDGRAKPHLYREALVKEIGELDLVLWVDRLPLWLSVADQPNVLADT